MNGAAGLGHRLYGIVGSHLPLLGRSSLDAHTRGSVDASLVAFPLVLGPVHHVRVQTKCDRVPPSGESERCCLEEVLSQFRSVGKIHLGVPHPMQTLPVSYAGLLLIFLAIILFIAEIKITSYGLLSLGGVISLIIGSMMFFGELGLSIFMAIPFIIIIGSFFVFVAILAFRSQVSRPFQLQEP